MNKRCGCLLCGMQRHGTTELMQVKNSPHTLDTTFRRELQHSCGAALEMVESTQFCWERPILTTLHEKSTAWLQSAVGDYARGLTMQ